MKKFTVSVYETIEYEVTVEAKDAETAERLAEEVIVDTEDRNQYFHSCSERGVSECKEVK